MPNVILKIQRVVFTRFYMILNIVKCPNRFTYFIRLGATCVNSGFGRKRGEIQKYAYSSHGGVSEFTRAR